MRSLGVVLTKYYLYRNINELTLFTVKIQAGRREMREVKKFVIKVVGKKQYAKKLEKFSGFRLTGVLRNAHRFRYKEDAKNNIEHWQQIHRGLEFEIICIIPGRRIQIVPIEED